MKIDHVSCKVLKVPYTYPLLDDEASILVNFADIGTDTGLSGYAVASYPMRFPIRDFINIQAAPVLKGMDPFRVEEARAAMYQQLTSKCGTGISAASLS